MASDRWEWVERARRYRSKETGQFVSASSERELRDAFIDRTRAAVRGLAEDVASGALTPAAWEEQLRTHVRLVHTAQYLFGRGGTNAVGPADRLALSSLVHKQWAYLGEFADDVVEGTLSAAQIGARAEQYVGAAVGSYSAGRAAAYGALHLPAHPGDGSTRCHGNCRCSWAITETDTAFECSWQTSSGESCEDCIARSERWAPLVVQKGRAA